MPEVSVLIGVYNGETYLRESVQSVLGQTFSDFEVIVVDDGSIDRTFAILQELAGVDKRIRIVKNSENIGLTKSLDIALSYATGRYIARQDCGDISAPTRFEKQLSFFETHPGYAMCGTAMAIIDESGKLLKNEPAVLGYNAIRAEIINHNTFVHGSVMIDSSMLRQIGGYNENFVRAQDYDLFLRISRIFPVDNLEEALYLYRLSPDGISLRHTFEQCLCAEQARNTAAGVPNRKIDRSKIQSQALVEHGRYHMLMGNRLQAFKAFGRAYLAFPTTKSLLRCIRPMVWQALACSTDKLCSK